MARSVFTPLSLTTCTVFIWLQDGGSPSKLPPNMQIKPQVIKCFSCSTQLSMKFFLLININMPTTFGILTLMSGKNSILGLSEPEKKPNF